jgi:hypothetical protein
MTKTKLSETVKQADDNNILQIRCSGGTHFSCAVFLLISAVFIFLGWYTFFTGQMGIGIALIITIVLLPFAVALFAALRSAPGFYLFNTYTIVEKSLAGKKAYPMSKITSFSCGQRFVKVNAKIGSYFAHFVELKFDGINEILVIDNKDTNYPIEELSDFLTTTYHLEGIKTVVVPERGGKK